MLREKYDSRSTLRLNGPGIELVERQDAELPTLIRHAGTAIRFSFEEFLHGKIRNCFTRKSDATSRWSVLFCGPSAGGAAVSIEDPSEWIADIDVLAQRAPVPDDWNDVRLHLEGGHLKVEVYGWSILCSSNYNSSVVISTPDVSFSGFFRSVGNLRGVVAFG